MFITLSDRYAQLMASYEISQHIALRTDHRKPSPNIIEHPRTNAEMAFQARTMRADAGVTLGQITPPLLIRDPFAQEVYLLIENPELLRGRARQRAAVGVD